MKTILLTGAAGNIGRSLRQLMGDRYHFRCLDIRPDSDDMLMVDITDFQAVREVMSGVDAVIHLAANPSIKQPWEDVYTSSIGGTYNVFEAARQAGVRKIIYASTIHVSGWREIEQQEHITPEMPVRPDSLYAVGKAYGEALGSFFADKYKLSVICLRIGGFIQVPKPKNPDDRILRIWCSPRDLAQLLQLSLDTDDLGFQIFYGISGNSRRFWDISNAEKLLGYQPRDDAERYLT